MTLTEILELRKKLTDAVELIDIEIMEYDWRHLVSRDMNFLAMKTYRKMHECSLMEAKQAVDAFRELIRM